MKDPYDRLLLQGARRASAVPGLPTFAEQGIPGFAIEAWYGIVAPAGIPPEIIAILSSGLSQARQAPEVRQRFEEFGYEPIEDTPAQFGARIRADVERYATLIKRVGIKADHHESRFSQIEAVLAALGLRASVGVEEIAPIVPA